MIASEANGANQDSEKSTLERQLFRDNISLLLDHQQDILASSDYFHCPLSFGWCSFIWVGGSGPFCLGHLLLGWSTGILIEPCAGCSGEVLITCFGGSILSGRNWCSGLCRDCRQYQKLHPGTDILLSRLDFAITVRTQFPPETKSCEEFDSNVFSWGGNGIQPTRMNRLVTKPVHSVALETLVEELKTNKIRCGEAPNAKVAPLGYNLELHFKNRGRLSHPIKLIGPDEVNGKDKSSLG